MFHRKFIVIGSDRSSIEAGKEEDDVQSGRREQREDKRCSLGEGGGLDGRQEADEKKEKKKNTRARREEHWNKIIGNQSSPPFSFNLMSLARSSRSVNREQPLC